jgi:predicted ribosome quality control (RQC) complex YloA/Tae2 family protein
MSYVLDLFYLEKDRIERSKQKKSDVLKVLNNNLDRCNKKLALQFDKLREVADRDKLKLFGELIQLIYTVWKRT